MSVPRFETERLILRAPTTTDTPNFQKNFADYEVIRYLAAVVPWPYPPDGAETFLKTVIFPNQGKGRWFWALFLKDSPDEMIGLIELWRAPKSADAFENRGFWLAKKYWGKGLMTEAAAIINDYAFDHLGFEFLRFRNAVENKGSAKIKEKTGARKIGTCPGKYVDPNFHTSEIWELTKEEWQKFKAFNK